MYNERLLGYLRHCKADGYHFFLGIVHAQIYKKVVYNVVLKISPDGLINGTHCECAAGEGGTAHCKHVVVCLLGVEDMVRTKSIVLRQVCTQELQSFHKPKKSYQGTPLKAQCLQNKKRKVPAQFDPRPVKFRKLDTNTRIKNLFAPLQSTCPIKTLIMPANPYAIDLDHTYSSVSRKTQFLEKLQLLNVTDEDIKQIELKTRGQSNNAFWKELRRFRITASNFYDCCVVQSESAAVNLAKRLLNPKKEISSDAVIHGIVNEPKAVEALMKRLQG